MKEEIDDIELIRRYLTQELNPDELKDVQKRMEHDVDFKYEVDMYQMLGDGLKTMHADNLNDKLNVPLTVCVYGRRGIRFRYLKEAAARLSRQRPTEGCKENQVDAAKTQHRKKQRNNRPLHETVSIR